MKSTVFNVAVAGFSSTVVLVIWGMIFWGWLYQFFGIFNKLPNDTEVVQLLSANGTETGTYFSHGPEIHPKRLPILFSSIEPVRSSS